MAAMCRAADEASNMTVKNMTELSLERDNLFRKFQIEKFSRRKTVPCVSMMIDLNIDRLEDVRRTYNLDIPDNEHVSFTHVFVKATALALKDFPLLYGYFDGEGVRLSDKIRVNLPVTEGNHVEYVVIESPEGKSLPDIAGEVREEVKRIRAGNGTFHLVLKKLFALPKPLRFIASNVTFINIRNTYRNYGNFPITNFGSFGAKTGIPMVSSPIIAVLCLGMI